MLNLCRKLEVDSIVCQNLSEELPYEVVTKQINNSKYINSDDFRGEFYKSNVDSLFFEVSECRGKHYKIGVEGWRKNGEKRFFDEIPFLYPNESGRDEILLRSSFLNDEYVTKFSEFFGEFRFIPRHDANLTYFIKPHQIYLKISSKNKIRRFEDYTLKSFWNKEVLYSIFSFVQDTSQTQKRNDARDILNDVKALIISGVEEGIIYKDELTYRGLKGIDNLLSIISLS